MTTSRSIRLPTPQRWAVAGMNAYRKRFADIEMSLVTPASRRRPVVLARSHDWFTLDWNARRLAVFDHDSDAIIRTHAKGRRVAVWFEDTPRRSRRIASQ